MKGLRLSVLALVASVVTGCGAGGPDAPGPTDPYAGLRGLVLEHDDLAPRSVVAGELSLPATSRAYTVEPGRTEDLRALAERYAGGPVTEASGPNLSRGLTTFDTGAGWFVAPHGHADDAASAGGWSWYEAAWRKQSVYHPVPMTQGVCSAPPDASMEQAALAFFERAGVPVELLRPDSSQCVGDQTMVYVSALVDGVPLVETAWARVDPSATVVEAGGPLLRLTPIGEVELAPAAEVLRRLVQGPGRMNWNCRIDCTLRTADARLVLAHATNGGFGGHDHTPGGVVEAPASQVLVPAVLAPGDGGRHPDNSLPDVSYSAVPAMSSAVMVDDPAQAEAARQADATSSDAPASGPACAGLPEAFPVISVCTSQTQATAGVPVLLTAIGERFEPVGARGCTPLFTLDPGDGTGPQSFLPRSGTLITARVAHTYTDSGTYDVVVHAASRCSSPAPGGGTEPEYDESAHVTVTVAE